MKDAEEIVIPFQKSRKEYLAKTNGAPNLPLSVIEKELLEVEALMQNVESYLLRDDISGESKRLDMADDSDAQPRRNRSDFHENDAQDADQPQSRIERSHRCGEDFQR